MKPSPLHLTDYFLTELHFSANSKFDANQEVVLNFDDFQVGVQTSAKAENKREWQVIVRLQHQPAAEANVPYRITAEMIGLFVVVNSFPEERIEWLVTTNGASILYGMLREVIRETTARGPYAAILIPSASFYDPDKSVPAAQTPKSPEPPGVGTEKT